MKIIWTIGHSTHSQENFFSLLNTHKIETLSDIRRFPGSKRYPQFNKDQLQINCLKNNIEYHHFESLGGRRSPKPDSKNTEWKNTSFRGYADYMESQEFISAAEQLQKLASEKNTAYMCSESLWWKCHRALVSDYLKRMGWMVLHIHPSGKTEEHPFTSVAQQQSLF